MEQPNFQTVEGPYGLSTTSEGEEVIQGNTASAKDSEIMTTKQEQYPNIVDMEIDVPERLTFGKQLLDGHLDVLLGGEERPGLLV
ncbi:MAG: hypothetical protein ACXABY_17105 [Candidatus Thorarchaeota archaeon]|jgi:hypothetical protein